MRQEILTRGLRGRLKLTYQGKQRYRRFLGTMQYIEGPVDVFTPRRLHSLNTPRGPRR